MRTIIETKYISNIPVLEIYNFSVEQKCPMIFILHGAPSCKENHLKDAYILAQKGYYIVLFDAYGNGELASETLDNAILQDFKKAFDVYLETSKYINILIDSYDNHKLADNSNIALIGFSMGGNVIFNNIVKERKGNVKAAVSYAGSPVWTNTVRRRVSKIPPCWQDRYDEECISDIEKYVQNIEPYKYLENLTDFPLLMINGGKDEIMPFASVKDSYEILLSQYTNKELIKFIEFKDSEAMNS